MSASPGARIAKIRGVKTMHGLSAFCVALAVVIWVSVGSQPVLAQGSAGGSIGKQGKSSSGSEETKKPRSSRREKPVRERAHAPARRQQAARPRREEASPAPAASSQGVAGSWRWSASCEKGARNYTGVITFTQSGNTFTGTHGRSNLWDTGYIRDGRIDGSQVSFTRVWGAYQDHISMTMSGGRMTGTLPFSEHSGRCSMSLVRN